MGKAIDYSERQCIICGSTFIPTHFNQKTCPDPECKREMKRRYQRKYNKENYNHISVLKRTNKRKRKQLKPDTIVAEGYAERQKAETLKMAGKVKTEL